jgi:hypothetical protein
MTDPTWTRRRVLLSAGAAAALSGCSGLGGRSDDSAEAIPITRLPDVPDPDESTPIVEADLPVDIERDRLAGTASRVTDLLGRLPMPLGPEDIPNGHVREELVAAAERATDRLDAARSAGTRLSAMGSLRRARTQARYAAAGWAFVADGRTEPDLRSAHRETLNEANAFRSEHEYRGEDPVRAVVVHAGIEETIERIFGGDPAPYGDPGALLTVAEWGESAESARAGLEDSRYLYGRFGASLPSDAGDLASTFEASAESLTGTLERHLAELPAAPEESDSRLRMRLEGRLHDEAESSARSARDIESPARTVQSATGALVDILAYDRLRDRIDEGERFRAETGEDVRAIRSEALSAIRTGLEESPRPALVRGALADAAWLVVHADDELARQHSNVRPAGLDDTIRRYVTATLRARNAPAACREVLDTLES